MKEDEMGGACSTHSGFKRCVQNFVRFKFLMAAGMKFRVFWDVVTLKWTDVSEVRAA
jgi:hypothetical protein